MDDCVIYTGDGIMVLDKWSSILSLVAYCEVLKQGCGELDVAFFHLPDNCKHWSETGTPFLFSVATWKNWFQHRHQGRDGPVLAGCAKWATVLQRPAPLLLICLIDWLIDCSVCRASQSGAHFQEPRVMSACLLACLLNPKHISFIEHEELRRN